MEERKCGVCKEPVDPKDATKIVVNGNKDSSRRFPGYQFSMHFHRHHSAKEKMEATQVASDQCEAKAIETGAYIRWRF